MRLCFSSEANSDFRAAVEYYDAQSTGLGDDFAVEVERVVELLLDFPLLGASSPNHGRGACRLSLRRVHPLGRFADTASDATRPSRPQFTRACA